MESLTMSKRTRHADNSKRQQPIQQQRAQARQTRSGLSRNEQSNPQPGRDKQAANDKQR
jgi:hypothetical protein